MSTLWRFCVLLVLSLALALALAGVAWLMMHTAATASP